MPASSASKTPVRALTLLGGLFALSGATALVYEVVWFRLIFLRLGGTGLSVATVTASFMAGLGLGAWLFGDRLARHVSPVRLYAALEAFIGLYALVIPALVGVAAELDTVLLGADAAGGGARLVRYLLVGILLLPATMSMGGTLPVLARLVEREGFRPGRFVGALYGFNTTGAVFGAAAGGFLLLPRLGFSGTVHACAGANLVLAVAALLLARSFAGTGAAAAAAQPSGRKRRGADTAAPDTSPPRPLLALLAYTTSGLVAFMLQVSWTRILTINFASSLYAFSLILSIFLTGLGLGALLAAPILDRTAAPARALAWTFGLAGATALLGQALYQFLPSFYLQGLIARGAGLALGSAATLAMAIMLPTTLALGVGFPLAVRLATGDGRTGTAAHVGRLYAANTSGAVVGAFATALFLIPAYGLAGVVSLAGCLALGLGLLLALVPVPGPRRPAWGAAALIALAALAWATVVPAWNKNLMSQSVAFWWDATSEQEETLLDSIAEVRHGGGPRLLFYQDGVTATIAVKEEGPVDGPNNRYLTIDGKIDASSTGDMRSQVFSGQLPLLLAKQPVEEVMVIGLASGVTTGSVLSHPSVKEVVVLEIEGAVHEAATYFNEINSKPLEDPRTRVVVEDARAYVERTDRVFDAIVSEPSSAWLSGSARLFTLEAFSAYRDRLVPGGILLQWLQTYDLSTESLLGVVRTLQEVFPHVAAIMGDPWDLLLLASDQPISLPPGTLAQRMSIASVARDLALARATSPCQVLDAVVAEPAAVAAAVGPGPLNTDDNAWVELNGPEVRGTSARNAFLAALRAPARGAAGILEDLAPAGPVDPVPLADQCLREGAMRAAASLARHRLQQGHDSTAAWILGEALRGQGRRLDALAAVDDSLAQQADEPRALITRALILQDLGRYGDAVDAWNAAERAMGATDLIVVSGRGQARLLDGDYAGAVADLQETRRMGGGQTPAAQLVVDLAHALVGSGRGMEARLELEAFTAGVAPRAESDLAVIAARELLADLLAAGGSGAERLDRLRQEAADSRRLVTRRVLREARLRLETDGAEAAGAYLQEIATRDPGMPEALRAEAAQAPPEGPWPPALTAIVEGLEPGPRPS